MPIIDNPDDPRARIEPKSRAAIREVFGVPEENQRSLNGAEGSADNRRGIMSPLLESGGLVFPYTPIVTFGGQAKYEELSFVHTNYRNFSFDRSFPMPISIEGIFTAQTDKEARYLLAVMHFLRTITKIDFGARSTNEGNNSRSGTPPPILHFTYLGKYMFRQVPVIVTDYSYVLPNDVDYIKVTPDQSRSSGFITWVPSQITITVNLETQQNTKVVRDKFNLAEIKNGSRLRNGFI